MKTMAMRCAVVGLMLLAASARAQVAVPLPPFTVYGNAYNWDGHVFTSNDAATVIAYAGVSGNAHNGNAGAPVFPVGFSGGDIVGLSSTAASGVAPYALPVQTSGILTGIPIGQFDLPAPTAAQRGARVYASTTTGKLTLTAPSGSGNFVQKVGVLTDVIGGTTANVDVQIGDMTILSP